MSDTKTTAIEQKSFAELFPSVSASTLPIEIVREIQSLAGQHVNEPRVIAVLAARDIEAASDLAHALQTASIKETQPEDWVVFRSKDGVELAYLQDAGCQRVRPYWGISFKEFDLVKDCVEKMVPGDGDEDIAIDVIVHGHSVMTGEDLTEIGHRGSEGFFERAWRESKLKPVARERIKSDIRKAAIANARGRLIRTFAGLGQMPVERLVQAGLKRDRMRGAEFQTGTKGGSGTGAAASEPQIQAILKGCWTFQKVTMLGAAIGKDDFEKLVRGAGLTGGREGTASALIDRLTKIPKDGMTIAELEKALGVTIGAPEPGAEG